MSGWLRERLAVAAMTAPASTRRAGKTLLRANECARLGPQPSREDALRRVLHASWRLASKSAFGSHHRNRDALDVACPRRERGLWTRLWLDRVALKTRSMIAPEHREGQTEMRP